MSSQVGHRSFYPLPRPSLKSSSSSRPRAYLSHAYDSWSQAPSGAPSTMGTPAVPPSSSYPVASNGIPLPPIPHVHFPPTPGMCQTYQAYSRREYDRTATIVTAPSECSLPARGCPGRTHYPIALSSSYTCASERTGRVKERCQTPGPSRSSSRNRTPCSQLSPPPSPSYYTPHIFYTAEELTSHFKDSPAPSPRPTPPLLSDHSSSDEQTPSDTPPSPSPAFGASLSNLNYLFPEFANQIPVNSRTNHNHNHIGLDTGANSVFAITNALNGLSIESYPPTPKKKKSVRISPPSAKDLPRDYHNVSTSTSPKVAKTRRAPRANAEDPGCLDGF